jgi:hypothetical protein
VVGHEAVRENCELIRRGCALNLLEDQRYAIARDEHLRAAERAQSQEVAVLA